MTSLLQIAASGVAAAAAQLNTTSQNIANASTTGYVRETVSTIELANTSSMGTVGTASSQGVMVTGIHRNVDAYLQSEARRTNSDAARADALDSLLVVTKKVLTTEQREAILKQTEKALGRPVVPRAYRDRPKDAPHETVLDSATVYFIDKILLNDRSIDVLSKLKPAAGAAASAPPS